jgi:hypothetical protein
LAGPGLLLYHRFLFLYEKKGLLHLSIDGHTFLGLIKPLDEEVSQGVSDLRRHRLEGLGLSLGRELLNPISWYALIFENLV